MKFSSFSWFFFVFIVPEVLLRPTDSEDGESASKNLHANVNKNENKPQIMTQKPLAKPTPENEPPIDTNQGKEKSLEEEEEKEEEEKSVVEDLGCINEIAGRIRQCIMSEPMENRSMKEFAMDVHSNWSRLAAKREENIMGKLEQKTAALAQVAPLYVRLYIERTTARLLSGCLVASKDDLRLIKALSLEGIGSFQESDKDTYNKLLQQIQTFINSIKAAVLETLGKAYSGEYLNKTADDIVNKALAKVEAPMGLGLPQMRWLLEPAMKDTIRTKVGDYYTFWIYILTSEVLAKDHADIIWLKKHLKKFNISVEEFAREILSMWVRTLTFGVHTPSEDPDFTLELLIKGMRIHKMLYPTTESVLTILFQFMTVD